MGGGVALYSKYLKILDFSLLFVAGAIMKKKKLKLVSPYLIFFGSVKSSMEERVKECLEPGSYHGSYFHKGLIRIYFSYFCRDIYYAKYYGKGGGGNWPAGEKNEIRS